MAITTDLEQAIGECKVIHVVVTPDVGHDDEAPFEAYDVWCERCLAFPAVLVSEMEAIAEATEHDCSEWDGAVR